DRRISAARIEQLLIEPPIGEPPAHPLLHAGGPAGGGGDEELIRLEPADDAVVEDHALVVEHGRVPDPADLEITHSTGIEPFEQRNGLRALTAELPQP